MEDPRRPIVAVPTARLRSLHRCWSAYVAILMALAAIGPYYEPGSYQAPIFETVHQIPWAWWSLGWGVAAVANMSAALWGRRVSWIAGAMTVVSPSVLWTFGILWQHWYLGTPLTLLAHVLWLHLASATVFIAVTTRYSAFVIVAEPIRDRRTSRPSLIAA